MHLCSECEDRPVSRAVLAIVRSTGGLVATLDPPEELCLTCYRLRLEQAAQENLRLETIAVTEDGTPYVETGGPRERAAAVSAGL